MWVLDFPTLGHKLLGSWILLIYDWLVKLQHGEVYRQHRGRACTGRKRNGQWTDFEKTHCCFSVKKTKDMVVDHRRTGQTQTHPSLLAIGRAAVEVCQLQILECTPNWGHLPQLQHFCLKGHLSLLLPRKVAEGHVRRLSPGKLLLMCSGDDPQRLHHRVEQQQRR